jgi:hypothetical protein
MRRWKTSLSLTWFWVVLSVTAVIAQETCSELLEQALSAVDENCNELDRNNACYGFNLVEAAFAEEVADDYFAEPADVASILDLETIATTAMDEENETWGVAVMNIQANVPNTIPGQNVTFVLMGDTEIANGVPADEAFEPSEGIEITVNAGQGGNVRSGPGLNFNVIGVIANNATILADAKSEDGAWFRVPYNDRIAWINEVVLTDTSALADLPVITPELHTSMQAFYLRTGIGQTSCEAAPDDVLLIQGPENIEIELTINGANVALGSTIGVRTPMIDDKPFLEVMTIDGDVEVDGVPVPPGYRTLLCLEETDELSELNVTCEPSTPEPVDDFGADWCVLEDVPANILNYQVEVLCPGEVQPTPVPQQPAATAVPDNQPEATAEPDATEAVTAPGNSSLLAEVDCSTFQLIGPFSNITPRPTLFSWTAAPGATDYQIVFYNVGDNIEAGSFFTQETSIGVHVSEVPTGGTLAWEVRAYRNGQYACVSPRTSPIMRSIDPEDLNTAQFSAALSCSTTDREEWVANINWAGANPGDTVTATGQPNATIAVFQPVSASGSGEAGSLQLIGSTTGIGNISVSTSSGSNVGLGQCP